MEYQVNKINSWFNKSPPVVTGDVLYYHEGGSEKTLDYKRILAVRRSTRVVWQNLILTLDDEEVKLPGFSSDTIKALETDLIDRIQLAVLDSLISQKEKIIELGHAMSEKLDSVGVHDRYLSHYDIQSWINQHKNLSIPVMHPFYDEKRLPTEIQSTIMRFRALHTSEDPTVAARNERYIQKVTKEHRELFESIERYPLTDEQMRACVVDEDRNLLIAAAGSGKTSVITGKIAYLISRGLCRPEKILVLAFGSKAAEELRERLGDLLGDAKEGRTLPVIKTFHALGRDILTIVEKKKPALNKISEAKREDTKNQLAWELLIKGIGNKRSLKEDLLTLSTMAERPGYDESAIRTREEYNAYLREMGATKRRVDGTDRIEYVLKTMDSNEVRSYEELKIANWLFLNGIQYEYERKYEYETADETHRQYYPDFYYPDADLYHEHWALDEKGKPPPFIKSQYQDGVAWKRATHDELGTRLIETRSADFNDGSIFDKLADFLKSHGIEFKPMPDSAIDERIEEANKTRTVMKLFLAVLGRMKATRTPLQTYKKKAYAAGDGYRARLFTRLFEVFYREYEAQNQRNNEIDYQDMINKAVDYLAEDKYSHPFRYILVDEFQDIAFDRSQLLLEMLRQSPETKLFAVGDDWQSIYRFTGSEISLMMHFPEHYGYTATNYLTQTFRCPQGITDVASTFVQKNPNQLTKQVKATFDRDEDQVILVDYPSDSNEYDKIYEVLAQINETGKKQHKTMTVFIMARFNHLWKNAQKALNKKGVNRLIHIDIAYISIHGSKGLERDYVLLINVERGKFGLPSGMSDDPLLDIVTPEPENYPYAEERRLLYVAITRAKISTYIFASTNNKSQFFTELSELPRVTIPPGIEYSLQDETCPKCQSGRLVMRTGRHGPFIGCSNFESDPALGCRYRRPVN